MMKKLQHIEKEEKQAEQLLKDIESFLNQDIKIEKNAIRDLKEVIKEVLHRSDHGLFAVEVQKLIFCSDLYSTERYGARTTAVKYYPRMYGAYSEQIRSALDELKTEISTSTGKRKGKPTTKFHSDIEGDIHTLGEGRVRVLKQIHFATRELSEDQLTKISKNNWLVKNADYDEPLNFKEYYDALQQNNTEPLLWDEIPSESEYGTALTIPDGLIPLSNE